MCAEEAHREIWSEGSDVSEQTQKAQRVCAVWQDVVIERFGSRFEKEVSLNESGPAQKIDLVDFKDGVGYELKSSPKNVHMEIYRDVFKTLVFNERNPTRRIRTLVFIAPTEGIRKLGDSFPEDVRNIAARLGLNLVLQRLP